MALYLTSVVCASTKTPPGKAEKSPAAINSESEEARLLALDDYNPKTIFDLVLRTKIKNQLHAFEYAIVTAGYPKGSNKYLELMALSLFVWDYVKEKPSPGEVTIEPLHEQELESAGLHSIVSLIKTNGGLGSADIKKDCGKSATALELLREKCGPKCFPKIMRLLALYNMAELPVTPLFSKFKNNELTRHTGLCLNLSQGKKRIFDPLYKNANAGAFYTEKLEWYRPIGNSDLLGIYHYDQGVYCGEKNNYPCAIEEYQKAVRLSAEPSYVYYNLGRAYLKNQEVEKAIYYLEKAVISEPKDILAYIMLGLAYDENNQPEMAVKELELALKLSIEAKNDGLKSLAERNLEAVAKKNCGIKLQHVCYSNSP